MRTITAPSNKGLHQTGREGVALHSSRPVVEARPAGEARCSAGSWGFASTALH
jgi:hypothetical protein